MTTTSGSITAHARLLHQALAAGDELATRRLVGTMLDGGKGAEIRRVLKDMRAAGLEDRLDSVLWEECQTFSGTDMHSTLFCLPVVLYSPPRTVAPGEALAQVVNLTAMPEERLALADAWLSLDDMQAMDPVQWRRTARDLGRSAWQAQPGRCQPVLLPRSCRSGHPGGSLLVYEPLAGSVERLPRFVLGAVTRAAGSAKEPAGAFSQLADRQISDQLLDRLSEVMKAVSGSCCSLFKPGMPLETIDDMSGLLHTAALEARLDAACLMLGGQPICHYCVDSTRIYIVMADREGRGVDRIAMPVNSVDAEHVINVMFAGSTEVMRHEAPFTMPTTAIGALH